VAERIQAIRGMNDDLPDRSHLLRYVENTFIQCVSLYAYHEIRFPLLESTQLFKRTIGEVTDIVEKEMYTFCDLNGDSITLRPEGTAGCVRACLEHGLLHNQQQKLWYLGPMFRHEKPQKGRYRQFIQLGVEAFGMAGVGIELELIAMCRRFFEELGIFGALQLQINTIGERHERQAYREALVEYFKPHFDVLDEDCKRRLYKNPLRILDSKNKSLHALIAGAPKLIDSVGADSRAHFSRLCEGLDALGISYQINPLLVRGLDYYGQTVFEWVTDQLGSQASVCAGGRFDTLIEQLGGHPTPAIGFAMGLERLLLLMDACLVKTPTALTSSVYMIAVGDNALQRALVLAEQVRTSVSHCVIELPTSGGSFKSQFKRANKSGARLALILGEDELHQGTIGVKDLRQSDEQLSLPQDELTSYIETYFARNLNNLE